MSKIKLSAETQVGLLVFAGIVLLVYMSLKVGGVHIGADKGYTLFVKLENASGLDPNASVSIAGVEVGRIEDISLEGNRAVLTLNIKSDIKVGSDSLAILRTQGLLGEKFLELQPGEPDAPILNDGDEVTRVASYSDIERLISTVSDVATDLREVSKTLSAALGGKDGEDTVRGIVNNLKEITSRIATIVRDNDGRVANSLKNLEEFSVNLNKASHDLKTLIDENKEGIGTGILCLSEASAQLSKAMQTLNDVGPEIKRTFESVDSIVRRIDKGEGTIGKLINDPETHDNINDTLKGINRFIDKAQNFRTYVGYRGEYLQAHKATKSYFSIQLQPKKDKFYLIEIIDDPLGYISREETTRVIDGVSTTITETKTTDEIKFTAVVAKKFRFITLKGGLIESTGGVGGEFGFFNDKIIMAFDAFEFGRSDSPRLKATARIRLNKYFFLIGGVDHIGDDYLESAFFGLGFRFEDEDIKYLLSGVPSLAK